MFYLELSCRGQDASRGATLIKCAIDEANGYESGTMFTKYPYTPNIAISVNRFVILLMLSLFD